MKVRAPCDGPSGVQKGDVFEISLTTNDKIISQAMKNMVNAGMGFFISPDQKKGIFKNKGNTMFCLWEGCGHIHGGNWERVDEAVDPSA